MSTWRYIRNSLFAFRKADLHWSSRNRVPQHTLECQIQFAKVPVISTSSNAITKRSYSVEFKRNVLNVDTDDIARHEAVADEWWDENGTMSPLHRMNDVRIQLIRNGLENNNILKAEDIETNPQYLNGIKIMDVGCGAGILCEPLSRLGATVTGLDPSSKLIDVARHHASENERTLQSLPNYVCSHIEDYAPNNLEEFDVLVVSEVIEHIKDKQSFLEACLKTLKPQGSIFFTTPNRTNLSWFASIVMAENVLNLLPKGIHDWNNFITPEELQKLLHTLGCSTVLVNGIIYNVLKREWSWGATTFHFTLHAIKGDTPIKMLSS